MASALLYQFGFPLRFQYRTKLSKLFTNWQKELNNRFPAKDNSFCHWHFSVRFIFARFSVRLISGVFELLETDFWWNFKYSSLRWLTKHHLFETLNKTINLFLKFGKGKEISIQILSCSLYPISLTHKKDMDVLMKKTRSFHDFRCFRGNTLRKNLVDRIVCCWT